MEACIRRQTLRTAAVNEVKVTNLHSIFWIGRSIHTHLASPRHTPCVCTYKPLAAFTRLAFPVPLSYFLANVSTFGPVLLSVREGRPAPGPSKTVSRLPRTGPRMFSSAPASRSTAPAHTHSHVAYTQRNTAQHATLQHSHHTAKRPVNTHQSTPCQRYPSYPLQCR